MGASDDIKALVHGMERERTELRRKVVGLTDGDSIGFGLFGIKAYSS